ncbi:ribosomal protein S18 acetylase RimI-like enzyme [Desulfobaculum xiamenense]|uniref:Ribosomal protein S18 acetylase RimI-like enzyme n=1 Tax=Desulfobaculum xiamenense TaxID=995050 RepID=A0A846QKW3_9BACT|nr:GNAT family N-acetyltransferase [Desulfobaculum xiamenense]NJB67092.1 ribosomal protein S18 acetylase RimI-like enzyme [Desulfobaculum xiamenense]
MSLRDDLVCNAADLVRRDEWLARRLGRPAFVVDGCLLSGLDAVAIRSALGALLSMKSVFAWTRILADAAGTACVLRHLGFLPVVTAVTMERRLDEDFPAGSGAISVRMARGEDEEAVRRIARESFTWSRFHRDPFIPRAAADALKEEWAANFFVGSRGDAMVVAEDGGAVVGFALFFCRGSDLVLDLVAVAAQARGAGVAGAMMAHASRELGRFSILRTVTQAENAPAMACYRKAGFRSVAVERVFHYHGGVSVPKEGDEC